MNVLPLATRVRHRANLEVGFRGLFLLALLLRLFLIEFG
jgi:hypothetical protein